MVATFVAAAVIAGVIAGTVILTNRTTAPAHVPFSATVALVTVAAIPFA